MFTGIVEEMGRVVSVEKKHDLVLWDGSRGEGFVIEVKASIALKDAYIGCSIATNGVCLTATEITDTTFKANCAPETLRLTNLGDLREGDLVNLERSMRVDTRVSGHFVQGHVDGTGEIKAFKQEGDSLWITIKTHPSILQHIVHKGFIAVDGTSLTVCNVDYEGGWFDLMMISHTQQCVIMPKKRVGDRVNLEVDVLSKFVDRSAGGLAQRVRRLESNLRTQQYLCAAGLIVTTAMFIHAAWNSKTN